ncbi:inorganic diphosphatase [Leucothrix mucor]|uniref:inorganic diphosphatase n=1 Tax=Leucothrix mucor TaxID=45248 RepID=UPI0003B5F250|nr:inorganic diphosphatase [Leucothrix mucor]
MNIDKLSVGKDVPNNVNVIIEIPANASPVKYEVDKDSGALMVDRFMTAPMFYPANYGFVPHTLADDGDPIDVLVVTPEPLVHGCVIPARPVGVLNMSDEGGGDVKIVAVPAGKLSTQYDNIQNYTDLPELLLQQIEHFFEHYKQLEKGKWVKIDDWADAAAARQAIQESVEAYSK